MSGINVDIAVPMAGGEFISGMVLVLCAQAMFDHGVSLNINNDAKRQALLNMICFICSVNCAISYGFNATKASLAVTNITTLITFICVQYGLVILNHNTIIRTSIMANWYSKHLKLIKRICFSLYFLPPLILIPIYFAFIETIPQGVAMNTSTFNSLVYKPMNIALIFGTELLAFVSDLLLLRKVSATSSKVSHGNLVAKRPSDSTGNLSASDGQLSAKKQKVRRSLWGGYTVIWALIAADVTLKILIVCKYALLFDSIVTILTVAMRARVNLTYGLQLQQVTGNSAHSTAAPEA